MRTRATVLASIALLLSACGSGGDDPIIADGIGSTGESSAVTASGADSAITDEGDDRPVDEADPASIVVVTVALPEGADVAGNAIVALEDITYVDAEAVEIANVTLPVAKLLEQGNEVELFLPLPLDGSIDVTATVHIDVDENGAFSQGDWISPELAMIAPGEGSQVTVSVVQI